jgi:hypothetical protein
MPLIVHASLDLLSADAAIRARERDWIDLSNSPSNRLAEQADTVRTHQTSMTTIYLGFLDPLFMLSPQHETLLRKVITACRVILLTSDPGALSLFWKNGLSELYLHMDRKDDDNSRRTQIVDNGGSVLPPNAS